MFHMSVYHATTLTAIFEAPTARQAWRMARASIRAAARAAGCPARVTLDCANGGANRRPVMACGDFRALPTYPVARPGYLPTSR